MGRKRNRFTQAMEGSTKPASTALPYFRSKATWEDWQLEATELATVHSTFSAERRVKPIHSRLGMERTIRERLESIRKVSHMKKERSVQAASSDHRLTALFDSLNAQRRSEEEKYKYSPLPLVKLGAIDVARNLDLYDGLEADFAREVPLEIRSLVLESCSELVHKLRERIVSPITDKNVTMFLDNGIRKLNLSHSQITDVTALTLLDYYVGDVEHSTQTTPSVDQGAGTCHDTVAPVKNSNVVEHKGGEVEICSWEDADVNEMVPNMVLLCQLDVSFCNSITCSFVESLSSKLVIITSLSLAGCMDVGDGRISLKQVGKSSSFPNLRVLDVSFNDWVTAESMSYAGILDQTVVSKHPTLDTLVLRRCKNFPSSDLTDSLTMKPRTKYVGSTKYHVASQPTVTSRQVMCYFDDDDNI